MSARRRERSAESGFTFIEVLVAVTLLVIGFLGIFASLHASGLLRETAHETNVAMFKLQTATEFMFSLAFDDMTTTMPEGTPIDIMKLTDSNANNDFVLNNEVMTVAYEDPAADPLKFTVTLTWDSRMGTGRSASISSGRVR